MKKLFVLLTVLMVGVMAAAQPPMPTNVTIDDPFTCADGATNHGFLSWTWDQEGTVTYYDISTTYVSGGYVTEIFDKYAVSNQQLSIFGVVTGTSRLQIDAKMRACNGDGCSRWVYGLGGIINQELDQPQTPAGETYPVYMNWEDYDSEAVSGAETYTWSITGGNSSDNGSGEPGWDRNIRFEEYGATFYIKIKCSNTGCGDSPWSGTKIVYL